jgi:hypothetical protein
MFFSGSSKQKIDGVTACSTLAWLRDWQFVISEDDILEDSDDQRPYRAVLLRNEVNPDC